MSTAEHKASRAILVDHGKRSGHFKSKQNVFPVESLCGRAWRICKNLTLVANHKHVWCETSQVGKYYVCATRLPVFVNIHPWLRVLRALHPGLVFGTIFFFCGSLVLGIHFVESLNRAIQFLMRLGMQVLRPFPVFFWCSPLSSHINIKKKKEKKTCALFNKKVYT